MRFFRKILIASVITMLCSNSNAQTRNVLMDSYEADSIERANFGNKNFHSEIKQFYSDYDSSDTYGLSADIGGNHFRLDPIVELSCGYSSEPKHELYNAIAGLSGSYHYGKKLTIGGNILYGISKPLDTKSELADSLGYFPELGCYKKNSENYSLEYFEFYANYKPAKYLMFSFGKGKKQLGEGYRSVLLSASNSGMYYFDTKVNAGSFNYTFSINGSKSLDTEYNASRTKWIVYHWISWNATKWLNIGAFEAVSLTRRDTLGNSRFVDLHYINPMIFTRPIEYSLGSPDNELMGVFGKVNFLKTHCIFGQFMLDEFKIDQIKDHTGWWADKYAVDAGVKGFVGKGLSYLAELNYIRPYMYSHWNAIESYSMFSQPLANPYGGNLKEILLQLKYQKKVFGAGITADFVEMGKDSDKYSLGNNILRSYDDREHDYDNFVCQGDDTKLLNVTLNLRYQPRILRNFYVFSQMGIQKIGDSCNKYCLVGIKTGQIYFDKTR